LNLCVKEFNLLLANNNKLSQRETYIWNKNCKGWYI
jgi:hypothetical protein